jgi:hypothetical protein
VLSVEDDTRRVQHCDRSRAATRVHLDVHTVTPRMRQEERMRRDRFLAAIISLAIGRERARE